MDVSKGIPEKFPETIGNRRDLKLGQFALVELPRREIPGEWRIRKVFEEMTDDRPCFLNDLTTREEILGDKLCELARWKLLNEVSEKYPELNIRVFDFYFELLLRERTHQWNFGGGLVAIEKGERTDLSPITDRTGMTFEEITTLVSQNKERILERVRLTAPNLDGLNLNSVEIGLPTVAELISLEGLNPRLFSDNRPVWTSTKVRLGGTEERVNLILNTRAYPTQEITYSKPASKADPKVGFFTVVRIIRPLNQSDN